MNRMTKTLIASVIAIVLLGSGLFSSVSFAQTPTPPNPPTNSQPATPPSPGEVFWSTLAAKLNVSVDSLRAAFRDAVKAVVVQLVKDGKLTQTQADKVNQRIDKLPLTSVPVPVLPQRKGPTLQQTIAAAARKLMLDTAANTLSMNPSDLQGELRDGLTLAEIAQQKGVDPNKLKTAMLTAANTRIDQAVTNGRLTQAQADQLKANLDKQLDLSKVFPLPKSPTP